MNNLLLPIAFLSSYYLAKIFYRNAKKLGFIAYPNHRSLHQQPTFTAGGISFVLSFLVLSYFSSLDKQWWITILSATVLLSVISLCDDRKQISALARFFCQLIAVLSLYYCAYDYFSHHSIFLSMFFFFSGIWFINLFNFMDGIDTLATLQAIIVMLCACLQLYYFYPDHHLTSIFLLATAAVAGFLPWNITPAKLFMGDVGSISLAFILLSLALLSISQSTLTIYSWLILMAMFWSDASITLLKRLWRGEVWHRAHRSHFYQEWVKNGRSHLRVSCFYMLLNIIWLLPMSMMSLRYPEYGLYCTIVAILPIVGLFIIKGETNIAP